MARIFSIEFLHNGHPHQAMVQERHTAFFTEYTIAMLDDFIAAQLPNNKIISTSKQSFVFSDSSVANSQALMESILHAIANHVHVNA